MNSYIDVTTTDGEHFSINTNKIIYLHAVYDKDIMTGKDVFKFTLVASYGINFKVAETPTELKHRIFLAEREVNQ